MRVAGLGLALGLCMTSSAVASDELSRVAFLEERLSALQGRSGVAVVEGVIAQGRLALEHARAEGVARPVEAARAENIADAAVTLAERRLERFDEQRRLAATKARVEALHQRAKAERRALTSLMERRAQMLGSEEAPR